MIDVEATIISQYGNSATISQLVRNMDQYVDPRADFDTFYDFVWNVETAQGFGLDIWGRIVNISRELQIPADPDFFGFSDALPGSFPFGEAPFYDGTPPATSTYRLADDAYRQLILVKALANISATNAPSLNQLLQNMFAGRGRCYVNDLGGMQLRYTFEFLLTAYEFAIMTQSGALPRPAGVGAVLINIEAPVFGFASDSAPFGQAPFIQEGATHAAN
jgi:hypothetical protein